MFEFGEEVLGVDEEFHGSPYLVCWYSLGFTKAGGLALLEPFLEAARAAGIRDHLVLHHFNEYGMAGEEYEGYDTFPAYVDRLVEEIDAVAPGRPLMLFGHSRGCCPAAAVATRLGFRVLAVYLAGSQGSIVPGKKSPWERLDLRFQRCGVRSMVAFMVSVQPGDLFFRHAAKCSVEELEELLAGSEQMQALFGLLSKQMMHCMHPDMSKGVIDQFPADICAISPVDDASCELASLEGYRQLTYGDFTAVSVEGGHMSCLKPQGCDMHKKVLRHMLDRWKSQPLEAWRKRLRDLQQDLIFGRLIVREGPGVGDPARALKRASDWVAANPWADEDSVRKQVLHLQRYMETQL